MSAHASPPPGEVLIEFRRIGNAVKVSAVHVASDTEVCLVGPAGAGENALKTAVLNKLAYVMGRRA